MENGLRECAIDFIKVHTEYALASEDMTGEEGIREDFRLQFGKEPTEKDVKRVIKKIQEVLGEL